MLARKSFWLTTFLLPAVVVLLVFVTQMSSIGESQGQGVTSVTANGRPIGYVNLGGVPIASLAALPPGTVRAFPDEQEARQALARGEIDRYYIVPADYVESGRLTVVQARFAPLKALADQTLITYVLDAGLTGSESAAALLLDPTPRLISTGLGPQGPVSGRPGDRLVAYMFMFIFYLSLVLTSSFVLQSVSREKENRTAEVLLVSMSSRDMMMGKVLGLSAVALIQVAVWLAIGYATLGRGASFAGITLDLSGVGAGRFLPWAVAYFLVGYVVYASVYAVLAALARTAREATQFVFIAILPLLIPLFLNNAITSDPDGALAVALSLFPLTSPVSMAPRLAATFVPWWQLVIGLLALVIAAYLFVLLAGRLFRANNLLSYQALSLRRVAQEIRFAAVARPRTAAAEQPRAAGLSAAAGEWRTPTPPSDGGPPAGPAVPKRATQTAVAAAALILVGLVEIARREFFAVAILAAGIILAAVAYRRYRGR